MFGLAFQLLDNSGGDYKLDWYRIVQDRDDVIKTAADVKSRKVSKFSRLLSMVIKKLLGWLTMKITYSPSC